MLEKLKDLKIKFEKLTEEIAKPETLQDMKRWQKLVKEHSDLSPIIEKYDELLKSSRDMDDAAELMKTESDRDMLDMLDEEYKASKENIAKCEEELKVLLLPKDENDEKNVIVEIRGGAGGDEAALFGAELKRMYELFAQKHRF